MKKKVIFLIILIVVISFFLFNENSDIKTLNGNDCSFKAFVNEGNDNVIILVHGLSNSDKGSNSKARRMSENIGKELNDLGFTTISVAYRESNVGFGTKDLDDVLCAISYAKDKVYLIGHSRGGYLVSLANTLVKTDGVVANGFVTDNVRFYEMVKNKEFTETLQEESERLIDWTVDAYGGTPSEVPEIWKSKSIIPNVNKLKAKSLFIVGTKESVQAIELMNGLENALNECDDCASYEFIRPDADHNVNTLSRDDVFPVILEFIGK